jgi:hypothetical protein
MASRLELVSIPARRTQGESGGEDANSDRQRNAGARLVTVSRRGPHNRNAGVLQQIRARAPQQVPECAPDPRVPTMRVNRIGLL